MQRLRYWFVSFKDLKAAVIQAKIEGTSIDTRKKLFDSLPVQRPMTAAGGKSFLRPAVTGESRPDCP